MNNECEKIMLKFVNGFKDSIFGRSAFDYSLIIYRKFDISKLCNLLIENFPFKIIL